MFCLDLVLASILSVQPTDTTSPPAPAPAPAPATESAAPAGEPAPTQPAAEVVQPAPVPVQPAPVPVQPTPAPVQPASGGELAPSSRTAPAGPEPSPAAGLGMLVTGPLLVLVAVPMSLVGNAAWRNNCGPNSSTGECADGSIGSFAMHTLAASSYGLGITFTGLGARKRAPYSVYSGRAPDGVPMIITGSTLLPLGLLGMGMARLFLWIGTTDCLEYSCVQNRQNLSTFTVAAGAAISAAGAGLLMYGAGVKRAQKHHELSLAPRFGRGFSGLGLTGRF